MTVLKYSRTGPTLLLMLACMLVASTHSAWANLQRCKIKKAFSAYRMISPKTRIKRVRLIYQCPRRLRNVRVTLWHVPISGRRRMLARLSGVTMKSGTRNHMLGFKPNSYRVKDGGFFQFVFQHNRQRLNSRVLLVPKVFYVHIHSRYQDNRSQSQARLNKDCRITRLYFDKRKRNWFRKNSKINFLVQYHCLRNHTVNMEVAHINTRGIRRVLATSYDTRLRGTTVPMKYIPLRTSNVTGSRIHQGHIEVIMQRGNARVRRSYPVKQSRWKLRLLVRDNR